MTTKYIVVFNAGDHNGAQAVGLKAQTIQAAQKEAKDVIDWPSFDEYDIDYTIHDVANFYKPASWNAWGIKHGAKLVALASGTAHIRASEEMS